MDIELIAPGCKPRRIVWSDLARVWGLGDEKTTII